MQSVRPRPDHFYHGKGVMTQEQDQDVYTLRRLYSESLEVQFMFSLSFWKLCLAFNLEYLSHFFINFNNWWQFWNPHDEHITNLSLIFEFHEEITEIIWNEKDETKLIFEKYQLSLTLNISAKTSSNWAFSSALSGLLK